MHVIKEDFNGNANVGLYIYATDKYCLVGPEVPKRFHKDIGEALGVPIHTITIAGTSLLGVFLAGNDDCLLVPKIAFESELKAIEKLKITYKIISTDLTALGNNVLCSEKGCIISPDFDKSAEKEIKEALGLKVKRSKIAGVSTVGALAVLNKGHSLVHRDAEDFEIEMLESVLGVKAVIGTVNFGSPYIKAGLAANSKGFIIGSISGGPEVQNADMALGFITG